MADFKKINGYMCKDEYARNQIESINSRLNDYATPDDVDTHLNGYLVTQSFTNITSNSGYITVDVSKEGYTPIALTSLKGGNDKLSGLRQFYFDGNTLHFWVMDFACDYVDITVLYVKAGGE